jgi:plastocyanin/uncharacterized protein (UPF0335 family)
MNLLLKIFLLLTILPLLMAFAIVPAYADHSEVQINIGSAGLEQDRCTKTKCFDPNSVTVDQGGIVIFTNVDSVSHTATSGTNYDGPSGEFDTGLLRPGLSFEYSPDAPGEINFFCMVHPWTTGSIRVLISDSYSEDDDHDTDSSSDTQYPESYSDYDSSISSSDARAFMEQIESLENENTQLEAKIGDLESQIERLEQQIDNLNKIIHEQIQVIYTWILSN